MKVYVINTIEYDVDQDIRSIGNVIDTDKSSDTVLITSNLADFDIVFQKNASFSVTPNTLQGGFNARVNKNENFRTWLLNIVYKSDSLQIIKS